MLPAFYHIPSSYFSLPGIRIKEVKGLDLFRKQDKIISVVCNHFGVKLKYLKGKGRQRERVLPRHLIYWLLLKHTSLIQDKIGNTFNQDRTTALHGARTIQDLIDSGKDFRKLVMELEAKI